MAIAPGARVQLKVTEPRAEEDIAQEPGFVWSFRVHVSVYFVVISDWLCWTSHQRLARCLRGLMRRRELCQLARCGIAGTGERFLQVAALHCSTYCSLQRLFVHLCLYVVMHTLVYYTGSIC